MREPLDLGGFYPSACAPLLISVATSPLFSFPHPHGGINMLLVSIVVLDCHKLKSLVAEDSLVHNCQSIRSGLTGMTWNGRPGHMNH